jgi:hypothetical protein
MSSKMRQYIIIRLTKNSNPGTNVLKIDEIGATAKLLNTVEHDLLSSSDSAPFARALKSYPKPARPMMSSVARVKY